ncbi:DUF2779 domain-containing protein [Ottowia pentelensis]|uniref:DUF2779 domain-containing protein n=1 Tax=Ottowia pentelensis TaxID=511108 RepID=A0ABV6PW87_9BURK
MATSSRNSTRSLTKSRFKLATECPRKLFYTGKREYLDRSLDDSFLAALADGGYQVGELARLAYADGVRIDELDHAAALERTAALLQQDEVTVFEAALSVGNLFIRVDILRKCGQAVELIEVKAKSYRAEKDRDFRGAKGQIQSGFHPYLLDVAFQRHVAQAALPDCQVKAFLLLVDKNKRATVDGLNQRFKIVRSDGRLWVQLAPGTRASSVGEPPLTKIAVDSQIDQILAEPLAVGPGRSLPFAQAVDALARAYVEDKAIDPMPSSACGACQFRAPRWPLTGEPRSGFHECWSQAFGWHESDFEQGTVLDLWNFRGKNELIDRGTLKLDQVTRADLKFDGRAPGAAGLTAKHRQWYACRADWPGGGGFHFGAEGYRAARSPWRYPLHFIDFETSQVALPFHQGRRPYETIAFQFSHHVMHQDGRVEHRSQWLGADPGVDPNIDFVRALREALRHDQGTVFRWAAHENTVLKHIREQLLDASDAPVDRDELVAFIESITTGSDRGAGLRDMVDLCDIAGKFFFHPMTRGSSSLKQVLPALMSCSRRLRDLYGHASYGGPGSSLNFSEPIAWWREHDGVVMDPYQLLPPVFDDLTAEELELIGGELAGELREGGAAMVAYARLQFEDLPESRRQAIKSALLRYCELDTLAMVMAVQAWDAMADLSQANRHDPRAAAAE